MSITTQRAGAPPTGARLLSAAAIVLRWVPAVLVVTLTVIVLRQYGVAAGDLERFTAYIGLALTLPGVLLWRALSGTRWCFAADVAAGTMVGYAVEVLSYVPARAAGRPLLVLTVPVLTVVAFTLVPGLRRHWCGAGPAVRPPIWWVWSVAVLTAAFVVGMSVLFFRLYSPTGTAPYVDMTYHLALAGELKHHMPPVVPYVSGEPLHYHWFFYSDLAATSWVTGLELTTLLFRLALLPVLAAFVVLAAVLGHRLTGRWWAGLLAGAVAVIGVAPSPYAWTKTPVSDAALLTGALPWLSPTQTLGSALFLVVMIVLTGLLRERGPLGRWILLAVVLGAVMGAKATYLPLLAAGLLLAAVVRSAVERRPSWPSLIALAMTGGFLVFAQLILYGGANDGLRLVPFSTMKASGLVGATGLIFPLSSTPLGPCLVIMSIFLVCYCLMWPGILLTTRRWTVLSDPSMLVLLGIGASGIGAVILFSHPGLSQVYFLYSARPYLAIASVWGIAEMLPKTGLRLRHLPWFAGAAAAGVLAMIVIRQTGDAAVPSSDTAHGTGALEVALVTPYAELLGVVAAVAIVLWGLYRLTGGRLRFGAALAALVALGTGLVTVPLRYADTLSAQPARPFIPDGAIPAGRWLRDHSSPNDLVATNVHCVTTLLRHIACDNRNFWVSGYTERRVLVEGWGYTDRINSAARRFDPARLHYLLPFWDPRRLTANDTLFQSPSTQGAAILFNDYHVRWLFVDTQHDPPAPALWRLARFRYYSGSCVVFQLPPEPS